MKRSYIISGLISLCISISMVLGYHFISTKPVSIQSIPVANMQKVLYAANENGEIQPLDFTKTTDKVLNAVVHIKSIKKNNGTTYFYRELNPFEDFFNGSPFGDFFKKPKQPNPKYKDEKRSIEPIPQIGTGSGVIINKNGYIITNNHVIDDAEEIEVTLHNNQSYKASVIGTDPSTDLALLQIKAKELTPLSLVNSDDVKVGEWVLAVGNPFSLNSTVTAGIVSAKARNINVNSDKFAVESFIQTDAAINPGNSGGALVNLNGDLIGINTAIASKTGTYNGYGFAVPSNIVHKVVEDLLKYGAVQRGILGVSIATMNSKLAEENNIDSVQGVCVMEVNEDSSADEAGIKKGDVIIKIDNKPVKTSPELQELLAQKRPGDKVKITYLRNEKEKEVEVKLKSTSGATKIKKKEHVKLLSILGADFEEIDKKLAKQLEIEGGVKVKALYPGKLRRETDIKEGFIITKVDNIRIKNIKDIIEAFEGKKGGVLIEGLYEDIPGKKYVAIGM